ncbi:MAG: monofunctional biosynthetic peptidoglycan transglycosylase [Gammaproteobacteria bacterium]
MKRTFWLRRVLSVAGWLLAAWLLVTIASVGLLRFAAPPVTAVMLREPGSVGRIEYRWVPRSAISANAARAVIASEDQKFLTHFGFDLEQLRQAVDAYRSGGELRGASTITQQVAKNLFLWNGRSFVRKGLEAYFTLLIETLWSKERILEVYLNIAELGPGVFGIEAAAEQYFGTRARDLTLRQATLLAAVLPAPKDYSVRNPTAYVRMRQSEIEEQVQVLAQRGHYAGLEW